MEEVTINRLGMNGEGIGRINNKVCFVKYSLPDEKVKVKIKENKKDYIIAEMFDIIQKSSNRVEPQCPYYQSCGGCDLQHLNYENQLDFKKNLIIETFKKIADLNIDVDNMVYHSQFEYRNKSVFAVGVQDGKIKIGMRQENSNNIVEITSCMLQNKISNKILKLFKLFLQDFKIQCNSLDKQGVKYIVVRVIDEKALITIVSDVYIEDIKKFELYLQRENIDYGLYVNINKSNKNILSDKSIYLSGAEQLQCNVCGIDCYISPNSFFQVNSNIQNNLYQTVLQEVNENIVLDCYSGAGLMSAILCKKAEKVYGIEIEKSATYDANLLKERNKLNNLNNINGDTKKELPKILKKYQNNICVILDPPRSGCHKEVLILLCENKVDKIIYISCLPRSLARDINILKNQYEIKKVIGFEMFPNTKHIETLVVLNKRINNE